MQSTFDKEIWKPIPNLKGHFASDHGRIKYTKIRSFYKNPALGYFTINVSENGITRTEYVHKLIADAFEIQGSGNTINHINGIKTDNRPCNLERCTQSENLIHAYKIGLKKPLLRSYNSKLDYFCASVIRLCAFDGITHEDLAKYFQVTKYSIQQILNNKCYPVRN